MAAHWTIAYGLGGNLINAAIIGAILGIMGVWLCHR